MGKIEWRRVSASVISAIIISIVFYVFSDCIFGLPDLSGKWMFESYYSIGSIRGRTQLFDVLIQQSGPSIKGTAEKIKYKTTNDSPWIQIPIEDRAQLAFSGYVMKKFINRDRINMHFEENNPRSHYSVMTVHKLIAKNRGKIMSGEFISSRGGSAGYVTWTRIDDWNGTEEMKK